MESQKKVILNRWVYIAFGTLTMLLLGTVYSYGVFRVALERQMDVGSAASGMPYMVSLAFYALFMFFTGKVIEKFHPRTVLFVGGLLVSLGWILSSFASNVFLLTLAYGCISGAGVGIAYGVPMSVVAKWFPDKKGLAVGLVLVGFGLSPLVTAPVVRFLVDGYGVMTTFLMIGLSFGVLLPLLSLIFRNPEAKEIETYVKKKLKATETLNMSLQQMIKTKSFKGVYLNFIVGTMIGLMLIGMTTNVGLDYFQLTPETVTSLMAIFAVFNGMGRPVFGWFTDRYSSRKAMLLSYLLMISASLVLVVFSRHMWIYILTFSVFWFNLGGWLAIAPTSTLKLYGLKHYGQNYGLVFTAYGIGAIAGVSTSGMLLDFHGDYHYVFFYIIALCFTGVALTLKLVEDKST